MKKGIIFLIFLGVVLALVAPMVLTQEWSNFDFSETGQIGDTIGGTTAPIIGVLSVLLLFYTLWEQIRFNKKQKEISTDEQFKSTFFGLLQVQRDILEKISGDFSFLGIFVYEEFPKTNTEINILRKDKEWATIKNGKTNNEICGLAFFKSAKYQLKLIYDTLDANDYHKNYDIEMALDAENELQGKIINGYNIPPEIEKEQDELIFNTRNPFRIAYITDKYKISKQLYDKYQNLPDEKKVGLGYAYFFNKYENVGYYFRHLYRILKFIKMNEDEKISSLKKNASKTEKDRIHEQYKQYAQFIQAQMSIEELLLLFYNSFTFQKAQSLIIHYGLLENLTIQNLIKKEHNCKPEIRLKDKSNLFGDLIKNEK